MSPQAKVLMAMFAIVLTVMVIAIVVLPLPSSFDVGKIVLIAMVLIFGGGIAALQVVGVNCMVVGNCSVTSWSVVMVLSWLCLLYVVVAGMVIAKTVMDVKHVEEETTSSAKVVKVDPTSGQIAQ